nr:energy transducer TonB [Candidatus Omnitrophota bacterium]
MQLFKDRVLNIAILISALWHFVFIFSIKPVLPTGHILEHNTSIAFLGDILESVGSYITEVPLAYYSQDQKKSTRNFRPKKIFLENEMDKLDTSVSGFINIQPEKKEFSYFPGDRNPLNLNICRKKEVARVNFYNFFIKGDARGRVIIYKPDLDKVTMLPSDFNSDFSANIKFRISKDGFVKYAECVISSGFSEIDQAAMRYVRKWQFVPASEDDQEGVVRVSFK